ncbi:MAG: replicative DNA helicase [Clostridia bacterium]|nr:replicative DNA helicase [Clostridia bacterium]
MEEYLGAKVPPYSLEAEQSVLGAMLNDEESVAVALENLSADDFYRAENKEVFSAMVSLFEQNKPIDVVTVCDILSQKQVLDTVGSSEFIANLAISVQTTANIKYYVDIIKEKALLRNLIDASSQISRLSYEAADNPDAIAQMAEKLIFDVLQGKMSKSFSKMGDVIQRNFARLEELQGLNLRITGLETGFSHLDYILSGLQKGTLNILAARPGVGKTSLALNIAKHVAVKNKIPVAVFSLEMSEEELTNRIISSQAMVDSEKLKTGRLDPSDWERLMQAAVPMSEAPLFIDDTSMISVTEIRSKCRRLKLEHGLGLIIVDYLQLMQGKGRTESRQREVSEMSRSLKILAKELEVPVLTLSQLSRSIETRADKTPVLSDLRESGAIEQDADVVMFLHKPDQEDQEEAQNSLVELIIAKHRSGSTGRVKLMWRPNNTTFVSVDNTRE